jgi:hypothetical protein
MYNQSMICLDKKNRKSVSAFFNDYKWNYLPEAILDGFVGEVLVDDESNPSFAVLEIPKLNFFIPAGDANHPATRDFITNLPEFSALIFASDGWEELLEEIHTGRFTGMQRYAFTSEKLDVEYLSKLAQIPNGFRLKQMDLKLAHQLAAENSEFSADHLLNFDSPEDFITRGFGFCLLDGDQIVSVATTFAICNTGIEIQINTRENYQRKGLATVVAARLLLHSLQKNLDPNWDAANQRSARLAEKLGYTPQGIYTMWFLTGARP